MRSIKNKALAIFEFVTSHDLDILVIMESWLGSDVDEGIIQDIVPSGLEDRNLTQHVKDATHERGNILDLLITNKDSQILNGVQTFSVLTSVMHKV
ncbi:uncharacterized protein LOC143050763 [Mytilus galloprovincialis]|uniref:uncharacterized protein LOC143050763 n=1 Tax=Mytilus galloprovincialis TaxID=29158 RepID=UPI003F7C306E